MLALHLPACVEMRRRPDLREQPVLVAGRVSGRPLVVDHFPAAAGVSAGMPLEQTLSRQSGGVVLEADEAAYRREFRRELASLQGVSDRVDGAELGTAYVGLDGLESLYGDEARLLTTLLNAVPQDLSPRAGVGVGKFPAYVAARTSPPLGAVRVPPDVAGFLAPQPADLLPISPGVKRKMRGLGLHTLGDVAAMTVTALSGRFGPEGLRAWGELARGIDDDPLVPLRLEETVLEHTAFPLTSVSLELLLAAVDALLRRVYAQPRMRARYACGAALECVLYRAPSWERDFHFRQPVREWQQASWILRGQLGSGHPNAPVEEVSLALSGLTGDSGVQLGLLPDLRGDRERRLDEAERQLQARMGGRPVLHRVV